MRQPSTNLPSTVLSYVRALQHGYFERVGARHTRAHRAVQRPLLQKLRLLATSTGYETQYVDLL